MKSKVVFVALALAFYSLAAYAQERTQRLFTNGVTVSIINNGDRLHFSNENTSGETNPSSGAIEAWTSMQVYRWTTIDLIIYYADGTNRVVSISAPLTGRQSWINLSKRATAISLPTAAQANAARNQREAAAREQAERERREAAERERAAAAERAQREAAERAERERREAAATEAAERAAVPTYMENGTAAFSRNDWDRAIAEFTRVIRIDPRYAMAYNNRGAAYNGKSDWDRAIADFTEAVRLDPNYAAPYRHRAFAYMQKGSFAQARTDVNRALQINPNYQGAKDLSAELQRRGH